MNNDVRDRFADGYSAGRADFELYHGKRLRALEEALSELADLMDAVCTGDYKPDSFTTQPARVALAMEDAAKWPDPDNPFLKQAEQQMTAAARRKFAEAEARERARKVKVVASEREAPMKLSALEQKTADQSTAFRAYMRFKRAEVDALLRGPMGPQWRELAGHLKGLTIDNSPEIMNWILTQDWLTEQPMHDRQVAISMIGSAIMRVRLENGLPPFDDALPSFDDALPGEEPTMFAILHAHLRVL